MSLTDDDLKKLDKMMKKAVLDGTGDALEAMVFPKFESIDKKFEDIDRKFDNIDRKFENIDRKFEQIDKRFENVDKNLSGLKKEVRLNTEAISRVERKLDQVTDHQAEQLDKHQKQIDRLNVAVGIV